MKLYPIVEGHGEIEAAPVLLRRLLVEAACFDLDVASPMRRTQAQLRGEHTTQAAVRVACLQPECAGVLILFDADDDCPVELVSDVVRWARAAARDVPCEVVIARREYESWFLAALESLRGHRGLARDAMAPEDPESRRDAKAALEEWMPSNRAYSETGDQAALSAQFDMSLAFRRSRSFRKLVTSLGGILSALGRRPATWPPAAWLDARA